jgi:hypothetical protein
MTLDKLYAQILMALLGGIAAELLHWYALSRRVGGPKSYKKHPVYWLTTAGMVLLGGFMPVLYLQGPSPALLCFHLGAATPVIVQKLVANLPAGVAYQGIETQESLKDFFRW